MAQLIHLFVTHPRGGRMLRNVIRHRTRVGLASENSYMKLLLVYNLLLNKEANQRT